MNMPTLLRCTSQRARAHCLAVRCIRRFLSSPCAAPAAPVNVFGLRPDQLTAALVSAGLPSYRATQVWQDMFPTLPSHPSRGLRRVRSFAALTTLSLRDRDMLSTRFSCNVGSVTHLQSSSDGTVKLLCRVGGDAGSAAVDVECVLIPDDRGHATLCVSSQAGCSLACSFCHTGTQAFQRNLSASDILSQLLLACDAIADGRAPSCRGIHNVVYMGMGEPGYNLRNVTDSVHILSTRLHPRRVTVSTAGVVPFIDRFADLTPHGTRLAVSLHASDDATRSRVMGINRTYSMHALFKSCAAYVAKRSAQVGADSNLTDSHSRSRITFEYVCLQGVNDAPSHARALVQVLTAHLPPACVHVNLIPFNPWPGAPYVGTDEVGMAAFQRIVMEGGIRAHIRTSRGLDILGACGQLRASQAPLKLRDPAARPVQQQAHSS